MKKFRLKNLVLSIAMVLMLASCAGDDKDAVADNKSTNLDIVDDEIIEVAEASENDNTNHSEKISLENMSYMGSADLRNFNKEVKPQIAEVSSSTKEKNDDKAIDNKQIANINLEELTDDQEETKELEDQPAIETSDREILYYVVEYNDFKKEYQNNGQGLIGLKNDGIAELDTLEFLDTNEKSEILTELLAINSLEDAINFMAYVRADKFDQYKEYIAAKTTLSKVQVIKVLSGDKIEVIANNHTKEISLAGIKAPELDKQHFGNEAYNFTKECLEDKFVYIESCCLEDESISESLVWIALPEDQENPTFDEIKNQTINGILTSEGYANPDDTSYKNHFNKMQDYAIKNNLGMWY